MTPFQLCSIGFAAQRLQIPIARIIATAQQLEIVASTINGVSHFAEADLERIRAAMIDEAQQRESTAVNQRSQIR